MPSKKTRGKKRKKSRKKTVRCEKIDPPPAELHVSSLRSPPNSVEEVIHQFREAGLREADSFDQRNGSWVADATIVELLSFLDLESTQQELTWNSEAYDLRTCYLDISDGGRVCDPDTYSEGMPDKNLIILVIHISSETSGLHFSAIIVNASLKLIHVFDTLSAWSSEFLIPYQ